MTSCHLSPPPLRDALAKSIGEGGTRIGDSPLGLSPLFTFYGDANDELLFYDKFSYSPALLGFVEIGRDSMEIRRDS